MEGLELNFQLVLALLEYPAACAFGTGSNITLLAIENSVKRSEWGAGMYPSRDVTYHYRMHLAYHTYFCLSWIGLRMTKKVGFKYKGTSFDRLLVFLNIVSKVCAKISEKENSWAYIISWGAYMCLACIPWALGSTILLYGVVHIYSASTNFEFELECL